jgi:hypothetical protein
MLREDFILSAATATPVFGRAQISTGQSEFATANRPRHGCDAADRPRRGGALAATHVRPNLDGAAVIM